jgi:hypothetical protein
MVNLAKANKRFVFIRPINGTAMNNAEPLFSLPICISLPLASANGVKRKRTRL